ncbi:MAG: YdcF family protein [Spirochaetota bacterium]
MFFTLSKVIPPFLYPLPLVVLAMIGVLIFYRYKFSRIVLLIVTGSLYVNSIPLCEKALFALLETPPLLSAQLKEHYEAVIVLAGMVDIENTTEERTEYGDGTDRILTGLGFVKQGRADRLIISGGSGSIFEQDKKEALYLKKLALQYGLSDKQILVEKDSRNTYESARYCADLIRKAGFKKLLLITSAYHMPRALGCFEKQGLVPDIYPVDYQSEELHFPFLLIPSANALSQISLGWRESIGRLIYKIQGYI